MKYLVISDIHGRTIWKEPVLAFLDRETAGIVVFLGDYNDSWDVSDKQMVDNFIDVILVKEQYPERVILLLGNHCFPYISGFYSCSGNRKSIWAVLNILYKANLHLFQMAYQVGNTLFTHAGLSTGWLEYNKVAIEVQLGEETGEILEHSNYAFILNYLFRSPMRQALWQVSKTSGGSDWYDGPLWVRPKDLWIQMPRNLDQVVGHTQVKQVSTQHNHLSNSSLTMTDTMANVDWEPLLLDL